MWRWRSFQMEVDCGILQFLWQLSGPIILPSSFWSRYLLGKEQQQYLIIPAPLFTILFILLTAIPLYNQLYRIKDWEKKCCCCLKEVLVSFLNPKAVYSGGKRLGFGKTSSQQYCNMKEYKTQFPQDSIQRDKHK